MDRKKFIQALSLIPFTAGAMKLEQLKNMTSAFTSTQKMPVFFIGHGNPMNAIEDNPFTRSLTALGKSVTQQPNAILVVSAHWLTQGTYVATTPTPQTIYDFGGFPPELYKVTYPAPGSPQYAKEVKDLIPLVKEDSAWGLDHGAWTVLKHLFPEAKIPVFQLSIDYSKPMQYHFDLAMQLKALRSKGVLIIGSGNIVHNLQLYFSNPDNKTYNWAVEFDTWSKEKILQHDFKSLINYHTAGEMAKLAVPTTDHYIPMIYSIALADKNDAIDFTYEETTGSISMRTFKIG